MLTQTQILFAIFLLLLLGAVIAFTYFVIKPLQTQWALRQARKIVADGKIRNQWRFHNVYRILATASNDLEAACLWQELHKLKEKAGNRKTE